MTPKIFAIASGKGGVGKTLITANTARILAKSTGKRVLLIDGDFSLSGLDVLLNLKCDLTIDDFLYENVGLENLIVSTTRGFDLLPASSGTHEMRELTLDQRQRLTYSLEEISANYDFILIDCPPGVARDTLQLCAISHRTILCATPDPTSITDTYAFIKLMNEIYREKHFSVFMNMVRNDEEAQKVFGRLLNVTSDFLGVSLDYAGCLHTDERIKESAKKRRLFVDQHAHTTSTKSVRRMSEHLIEKGASSTPWNGGLKALWPLFLNPTQAEVKSGELR